MSTDVVDVCLSHLIIWILPCRDDHVPMIIQAPWWLPQLLKPIRYSQAPWCFIWFHGSPPPPRANSPGGSPWDRCGMCCRNICATVWTSYWFHIMVPFNHLYIYIYTAHTYINIYIWGVVNMFSFSMLFFWKKESKSDRGLHVVLYVSEGVRIMCGS